jgi:hypothetical protein
MNASELASKMLEWEQAKINLDALEAEIKRGVLALGKTQTVGNVRASYSKGRVSYDYQTPVEAGVESGEIDPDALTVYQSIKTDWRKACQALGLDASIVKQSAPSVSIKLL